jgi:hypothetical protein
VSPATGALLGIGLGIAVLWIVGVRVRFYRDGEDYVMSITLELP